jgi:hypothetical protein
VLYVVASPFGWSSCDQVISFTNACKSGLSLSTLTEVGYTDILVDSIVCWQFIELECWCAVVTSKSECAAAQSSWCHFSTPRSRLDQVHSHFSEKDNIILGTCTCLNNTILEEYMNRCCVVQGIVIFLTQEHDIHEPHPWSFWGDATL